MIYKTLIDEKTSEFIVIVTDLKEPIFGTCSVPTLFPMTASLESLIKYYPKLDFEGIDMVRVELYL